MRAGCSDTKVWKSEGLCIGKATERCPDTWPPGWPDTTRWDVPPRKLKQTECQIPLQNCLNRPPEVTSLGKKVTLYSFNGLPENYMSMVICGTGDGGSGTQKWGGSKDPQTEHSSAGEQALTGQLPSSEISSGNWTKQAR